MSQLTTAMLLLAVLLPVSCRGEVPWPPPPAAVRLGEDACACCRMIVSDGRFAAQALSRAGDVEWFDDLGCLLGRHGGAACDPQGVFVRSFGDESWVRGDRGFAVRAPDLATPMGYGIAAFATSAEATSEAGRHVGATVTSLAALLAEVRPSPDSLPAHSPR